MSIARERPSRSANDDNASERINAALTQARQLIRYGVPVFPARVDEDGDPDVDDLRWSRWQKYPADLDVLAGYKRGDALAAVCGITFDVIDIDPRNGGKFSFNRMSEELGDFGPETYGMVKTPSGGVHIYIAALGIGSHNNVLPGVDLKGGNPDGTGRGFVFLPPTIRPVKGLDGDGGVISGSDVDGVRLGTYRWTQPVKKPGGDSNIEEITSYIMAAISSRTRGSGTRREDPDKLRQECIDAPAGGQRAALLLYVHELERKGYERKDILVLLRSLAGEMSVYDRRRPWYPAHGNPDRELLTLLHRPGAVIPDASPDEEKILRGISRSGPSVAKVIQHDLTSFADVERQLTEWLWSRWLAVGDITMLDGDAGTAKSQITLDLAARLTRGDEMPDGSPVNGGPGNVLLLAPEDSDSVTAGRLEAANADVRSVFRPALVLRKEKGEKNPKAYSGGHIMSFPLATDKVRQWVLTYGIRLLIVDPITAFLDEKVNSNNDASVRSALAPLSAMLHEVGCASIFIRHFNKNTELSAAHRGGGSVAFGAVSRVQVVAGEVPEEARGNLPENISGKVYGIAQVKNNHLKRRPDEVLAYVVEDSDIVADTDGNMAPRIRWLGAISLKADDLASPPSKRRGPSPMVQEEIVSVLSEMFSRIGKWDSTDALAELRNAGVTANRETIAKARNRMGVVAKPRYAKGHAGVAGWDWVVPGKEKATRDSEKD